MQVTLTDWIQAVLVAILVIITGWYAYSSYQLLSEARRMRELELTAKPFLRLLRPDFQGVSIDKRLVTAHIVGILNNLGRGSAFDINITLTGTGLQKELGEFNNFSVPMLGPGEKEECLFRRSHSLVGGIYFREGDEFIGELLYRDLLGKHSAIFVYKYSEAGMKTRGREPFFELQSYEYSRNV